MITKEIANRVTKVVDIEQWLVCFATCCIGAQLQVCMVALQFSLLLRCKIPVTLLPQTTNHLGGTERNEVHYSRGNGSLLEAQQEFLLPGEQ